jgi:hypothetical protein
MVDVLRKPHVRNPQDEQPVGDGVGDGAIAAGEMDELGVAEVADVQSQTEYWHGRLMHHV